MKNQKQWSRLLLVLILCMAVLIGCGEVGASTEKESNSSEPQADSSVPVSSVDDLEKDAIEYTEYIEGDTSWNWENAPSGPLEKPLSVDEMQAPHCGNNFLIPQII